jgi:hypothetical protein
LHILQITGLDVTSNQKQIHDQIDDIAKK